MLTVLGLLSCTKSKQKAGSSADFTPEVDKAEIFLDKGDTSKAFRYIDSAWRAQKRPTLKGKFNFYKFYCGFYYQYSKNFNKAMLYADSMEMLVEGADKNEDYTRESAEVKYSKGDILFSQQKYSEAYQYYFSAKLIGKNNLDPCNLSDYSFRMGMILYKQTRFKSAGNYFMQAIKELRSCADNFTVFFREQQLLDNIALCYYKTGALDSAMIYFNKAETFLLASARKYPDKKMFIEIAKGVIYGNQAQILKDRGKYSEAEALFIKSIKINSQRNYDMGDAQLAQLHLAGLYMAQGRIAEMLALMNRVKISMKSTPNESAKLEWNRLMWQYNALIKNPAAAYAHLLNYTLLKDSMLVQTKGLNETDVDEQLKSLENQYENKILRSRNELNTMYLKIAIVVAALSFIIFLLILKNWRISKGNVKSLTELNKQVIEQKQQLEQTLKELESRGKEKDRILSAVAHDLRNPIGGVASLSGVFLDEPGLSGEQKEMIALIQNTCLDALQLINEILELTIIDNLNNIQKEKVDVNSMLANAIELLRFKAVEKRQKLLLKMIEPSVQISINREKISRVLANLISNAIKFSPIGSVVKVKASMEKDAVRIAVEDNGIGIPEAIQSKVFDTFTDAKRVGTSGEKPFGLGLSISRQIVEAHNGRIWFESEAEKGSTFYIELNTANSD